MGVLYVAVPSDEGLRSWLEELGVPIPDASDGRCPTDAEIRQAVAGLAGFQATFIEESENVVVDITSATNPTKGPWAVLAYPKTPANDPDDQHLTFRKGWPEVMVPLLHRISKVAGPIALIPDTGGDPLLVYPGADAAQLLATWDG